MYAIIHFDAQMDIACQVKWVVFFGYGSIWILDLIAHKHTPEFVVLACYIRECIFVHSHSIAFAVWQNFDNFCIALRLVKINAKMRKDLLDQALM